mmetsp:Transcript_6496/g.11316  ORF Transcript_6496/g.11316 Transcript_6496/m.11316 type:complete len:104 (+) Transcript_6496:217-528(+)
MYSKTSSALLQSSMFLPILIPRDHDTEEHDVSDRKGEGAEPVHAPDGCHPPSPAGTRTSKQNVLKSPSEGPLPLHPPSKQYTASSCISFSFFFFRAALTFQSC